MQIGDAFILNGEILEITSINKHYASVIMYEGGELFHKVIDKKTLSKGELLPF